MTIDSIKRIGIREYLGAKGIKPQSERGNRAMYLSPFRQENTASFSVNHDENVWYDHGIGEGGSIIDLVARMERCSVGEAIRRLEDDGAGDGLPGRGAGMNVRTAPSFPSHRDIPVSARQTEPERSHIEIASVGVLTHPALMCYLTDRGIDPAAARRYCNEVRYRIGNREYFAIGFRNDAGGWELRNRSFKGSSAPKNITTLNNGSDTVMVFEGFVDFLSYLSLKQNPSPTIDTAVLNSVANLRRAIPFLESHRTVHAFLDNDEAGRKALDSLRELLPGSEVVDQSPFYRNHKDLNDYWRERITNHAAPKNRVLEDTAADKIKRPAPTEKVTTAVQVRRSVPATPVRKKGRRP